MEDDRAHHRGVDDAEIGQRLDGAGIEDVVGLDEQVVARPC